MAPGSYVLITPARNEAAYIGTAIDSVVGQTCKPTEWIIVDDGSTDDTAAIVQEAARTDAFITLLRRQDRGFDAVGGGVVAAFNAGLAASRHTGCRYLGKLDADIELPADYFERLIAALDQDDRLAIASGQNYLRDPNGKLHIEKHQNFHPVGGARLYRRHVLREIGGLVESPGWDTLDLIRAWMGGFDTRIVDDLRVIHRRAMGTRSELREGVLRLGRISYLLGYHPVYFALRVLAYMVRPPVILRASWLLGGYCSAFLSGENKVVNPGEERYLRRFQIRQLLRLGR